MCIRDRYMLGNLFSALVSVVACKLFPVTLTLAEAAGGDMAPPSGVGAVSYTHLDVYKRQILPLP